MIQKKINPKTPSQRQTVLFKNIDIIEHNNVLKCNTKTPSFKTRFFLKKNKEFTQILYGGDSKNIPVTLSGDGILRIAFENEINDRNTNFIIAASFKKA